MTPRCPSRAWCYSVVCAATQERASAAASQKAIRDALAFAPAKALSACGRVRVPYVRSLFIAFRSIQLLDSEARNTL